MLIVLIALDCSMSRCFLAAPPQARGASPSQSGSGLCVESLYERCKDTPLWHTCSVDFLPFKRRHQREHISLCLLRCSIRGAPIIFLRILLIAESRATGRHFLASDSFHFLCIRILLLRIRFHGHYSCCIQLLKSRATGFDNSLEHLFSKHGIISSGPTAFVSLTSLRLSFMFSQTMAV